MTLGEKLAGLRRENNYTQEQLAQILGVSRQAVSRWESNLAYPETEKLIRLARLYRCSTDYLLMDQPRRPQEAAPAAPAISISFPAICYERVSKRRVGALPLWHIRAYLKTGKTPKQRGFFRCAAPFSLAIHQVFLRENDLPSEKIPRCWPYCWFSDTP